MKKRTKQTPRQRELKNRAAVARRNVVKAVTGTRRRPKQSNTPAIVPVRSPLLAYDVACKALAQAKTFDQVREIKDLWEHVKLHARQVRDRTLLAEAIEIQTRAERVMGKVIAEAKERGWIDKGGRPRKAEQKTDAATFTLEEAGIDPKTSARAQKLWALPTEDFERDVAALRERVACGGASIINGARAVMAGRQQPGGDLDFAPTGPWITRALIEKALPQIPDIDFALREQRCWEPACGEGHMAEVLREYFKEVVATDIHDYGYCDEVSNFLDDGRDALAHQVDTADWIITNSPYEDKVEAFFHKAWSLAKVGVALLTQLRWLEGTGRYERVFSKYPPTLHATFAERAPLHMGRWDPDGDTLTAYSWIVWVKGRIPKGPLFSAMLIPPGQRQALEHDDDRARFTAHPVIRREAFNKQNMLIRLPHTNAETY